jgi:hypothetical protein
MANSVEWFMVIVVGKQALRGRLRNRDLWKMPVYRTSHGRGTDGCHCVIGIGWIFEIVEEGRVLLPDMCL